MTTRIVLPLLVVFAAIGGLILGCSTACQAATFYVTHTGDVGQGSLRQAITDTNVNPGGDAIVFRIPVTDPNYNPGLGVWTIRPLSGLPLLVGAQAVIDGTTQATYIGFDTNPMGPEIELDGSLAGAVSGLVISSVQNGVRVLTINRFQQFGILLTGNAADDNRIAGCYIGTDPTGTADMGNGMTGILMYNGAEANTIGGSNVLDRNLLSGNGWSGVEMQGTGVKLNIVVGNYIGVDRTGAAALGNSHSGINIWSHARENVIGGAAAGQRNVIGGNLWHGVEIGAYGPANVLQGNRIGTDAGGLTAIPNGASGVLADGDQNRIGGTAAGEGNLISGNRRHGIDMRGSANLVAGNLIGTDVTGGGALANSGAGVEIVSPGHDNTIGPANRIAFNRGAGTEVSGAGAVGNTVTENAITENDGPGIDNRVGGNTELPPPAILVFDHVHVAGTAPPLSTVEIFSDTDDEGASYEGTVAADGGGHFVWYGEAAGPRVTATATDAAGNTSEFSAPAVSGVGPTAPGAEELTLASGGPMPFGATTTIRYALALPARVSLGVHDVSGRLVRTLLNADPCPAGCHATAWDGRDDAGRPVAAGTYYARLAAGAQVRVLPVSVMR